MKIFLQELWVKCRDQDEKISDKEIICWKEIIGGLEYLTDIHISRFVDNGFVTERNLSTDSKCILELIKGGGNQLVFVRNRIKEITEKQDINFRSISRKHNPVDLTTRGISTKDLKDNQLWWHGPSWLSEDSQIWPTQNFPEIYLEKEYKDMAEKSKAVVFEMTGI